VFPAQVVDNATQMDVHKRLTLWPTPQRKCPMLRQQLQTVFFLQESFTLSKCLFSSLWILQDWV